MGADMERFGLRFSCKKEMRNKERDVVRNVFFKAFDSDLDLEDINKEAGDDENEFFYSTSEDSFENFSAVERIDKSTLLKLKYEEYDEYIEIETTDEDEIYGDMMDIFRNISDGIKQMCPDSIFELHWVEEYAGISDYMCFYNGADNPPTFTEDREIIDFFDEDEFIVEDDDDGNNDDIDNFGDI